MFGMLKPIKIKANVVDFEGHARVSRLLEIEGATNPTPYSPNKLRSLLRRCCYCCWVLETKDIIDRKYRKPYIIGWALCEVDKRYRKINILRFAIDPEFSEEGFETQLMLNLINDTFFEKVFINMRESDLNGHLFLKELEFKAFKVLRNFFKNPTEDAYCFVFRRKSIIEQSAT